MNTINLKLNVPIQVAESELEQFHYNKGGSLLLPELKKMDAQSALVIYEIVDGEQKAAITLRPATDGTCNVVIYFNESDRWAWRIGHSILGVNTYLGSGTSPRCKEFCERFTEHLRTSGFVGNHTITQIDDERRLFEEDIWAWGQYHRTNQPILELFAEWFKVREKSNRPNMQNPHFDPYQRFENIIYKENIEDIEPE